MGSKVRFVHMTYIFSTFLKRNKKFEMSKTSLFLEFGATRQNISNLQKHNDEIARTVLKNINIL